MAAMKQQAAPAKEKAKKAVVAPTKKTMNFVHHESSFNAKKLLPIIAVVILVFAAVAKFGIVDQLSRKTAKYAELTQKQEQLTALQMQLTKNSKLTEDYGRYSYGWMSADEVATVDRMEIIRLIDEKVLRWATVKDFAINNNTLTMNISGVSLERASSIVKDLESSELVQSAAVYSISTKEGEEGVINMGVVLANPTPEEATAQ